MAVIDDLLAYYENLLIIQYNNKPKARATIKLIVGELLASGILFAIRDAYNLENSVGKQLDVLGKYAGVDRFYYQVDLDDYFSLTTEDSDAAVDALPIYGFSTYANFGTLDTNGTLTYDTIITKGNALLDDAYRIIIKLKILQNTSNHSHAEIDAGMFKFFGAAIIPESTGGMHMVFFVENSVSTVVAAALYKQLLPRPMGVGLQLVTDVEGLMFGFNPDSPYITGFSTYADYDTVARQTLTYPQIS